MSDSRHHPCLKAILDGYEDLNGVPAPTPGRIAKRLSRWLEANPKWPVEVIVRCIQNRYRSEVNTAEEPWRWIESLPRYAQGPLDKWGKIMRRTLTVEEYWEVRAREAGREN